MLFEHWMTYQHGDLVLEMVDGLFELADKHTH